MKIEGGKTMLAKLRTRLAKLEVQMADTKKRQELAKYDCRRITITSPEQAKEVEAKCPCRVHAGRRLAKRMNVMWGLEPPTEQFPLPSQEEYRKIREVYGFPNPEDRVGLDEKPISYRRSVANNFGRGQPQPLSRAGE